VDFRGLRSSADPTATQITQARCARTQMDAETATAIQSSSPSFLFVLKALSGLRDNRSRQSYA
jgi:hypothetical protein